eukprot:7873826-Pyramimonas_sp.AAC.1
MDTDNPKGLLLLTRGIFPHPGDYWPRPDKEGKICWQCGEGVTTEEGVVMGELFLDGSCTRCAVPELNRAAWGLAIFYR